MTNAGRIRQMTDEELADFANRECPCRSQFDCIHLEDDVQCYDCWLEWLKQEAEDDEQGTV